ncbi:MAG: acyl-CoA dehydrogenase [Alphaproteobacteria bacterium]|nr:acyl-CoA dehydrogenase [Alphaproteobacteria bacterium]
MSGEDNLVAEAAERLCADLVTPAVARAAEQGTWPATLWRAVEEAGFGAALEPESGVSLVETLAIARAMGRHGAPIPLVETMLARALVMRAGLTPPDGPLTVGLNDEAAALRMGGKRLSGTLKRVPFARQSTAVVAMARAGEKTVIVLAPMTLARLTPGRNLAGEARDDLGFEQAELPDGAFAMAPHGIDEAWVLRMGALLRCAQMVGALEAALAMSVRYANERVQFGRPIGKFQAIQHQLAALGGEVAASSAMLDAAAEAVATRCERGARAVAAAKARASEAAGIAATIAHRVHGAIGFTQEYALQGLTRRLLSWRDEFGTEAEWHRYLGRTILRPGVGPLWPLLTTS